MQMAPHIARSLTGEDPFGKFEHKVKESGKKFWPKFFCDCFWGQLSLLPFADQSCGCVGNNIAIDSLVGV